MKIFDKILLSALFSANSLWGVEANSLEGLKEGSKYIYEVSVDDSLPKERSSFEKLVEGDLPTGFSDSIPLRDEDAYLNQFRQNLDREIDSFLVEDKNLENLPLLLYKENSHYYTPMPLRQEVQFEELIVHPFLLRDYQLYQDYSPFWAQSENEGNIYFRRQSYSMPILLTKAELAQGYNGSDLDQAIVNIYKSRIFECLDFQLGFNGSSGKWLSEESREKTKDLYGSLRYYWKDYFSLDYSFLHFDHDLPNEKLFFSKSDFSPEEDSLLDFEHLTYTSDQHFVVLKSAVFDAGYSYSHSEFFQDSLLHIDKKYNAESYFYALDLDFWGQNLAVGRKSYNNFEATKIDDRLYYKGKLQNDMWYGTSVSGYYDEVNKSFKAKKGLPWGFTLFADYVDKENLPVDTALFIFPEIFFHRISSYNSVFYGLIFDNSILKGKVALGNLKQTISEYQVLADTHTVKSVSYNNGLLQADMQVRLPFSLWGQKMALAYGLQARKYLSGNVPFIYPEYQALQSYEVVFYFDYGNVLTLGWRNNAASDYFANFADKVNQEEVSSNELLDYYLRLDLSNKFTVLMDLKNYDKDEDFLGTKIYRRHFKINFIWYLFD